MTKKSGRKRKRTRTPVEREHTAHSIAVASGNKAFYGQAEKLIRPLEILNAQVGKIRVGRAAHEGHYFMSVTVHGADGCSQEAVFPMPSAESTVANTPIRHRLALNRIDELIVVCGARDLESCKGAYVRILRPKCSGSGMFIAGLMHIVDPTLFVSTGCYDDSGDLLFSEYIDPYHLKLIGERDGKITTLDAKGKS